MTAHLTAEWRKLTTTSTLRWFLVGAGVVSALTAFISTAVGPPPWHLTSALHTGSLWTVLTASVAIFAVVLGGRTVTEEFGHQTIVHTFVADPGRVRSILAKGAIGAAAAAAVAVVSVAVYAGVVWTLVSVSGGHAQLFVSDLAGAAGLVGGAAAWAVVGVGLGALVRSPVPVIVGGLLWLTVVENVLGVVAGPLTAFLPGQLLRSVAGAPADAGLVGAAMAAPLLGAYAAAAVALGLVVLRRSDVL